MIAKGTPHRDGAILARYLVTGKEHERAELLELRGFACTGIVAAFRSVHVMAAATKCLAPFFHVSIRNPDGDVLDKAQWGVVANSVERMLGLTDQPRAVAFHTAEDTGHGSHAYRLVPDRSRNHFREASSVFQTALETSLPANLRSGSD